MAVRGITLKQLRAVGAIGRSGKIVAAAKALNLTPPAVTLQLQQIEREVGVPLYDRTKDGLRPTDGGVVLFETAVQIESLLSACEDRLAALRGLTAGRVAVGAVSTAKYFSPGLIAAFARVHPGIEVRLRIGNREEIIGLLGNFQIDLAIMGVPPQSMPVDASVLGDHPLVMVAPPGHRLASARGASRLALAGETLLTRENGSGTRASMDLYLQGMPEHARPACIEMGSNETIKQAVMAGLGIAFISAHTVAAELASGRLTTLDVEGLPVWRKWFVVRRADRMLAPAVAAFAGFLQTNGQAHLPTRLGADR